MDELAKLVISTIEDAVGADVLKQWVGVSADGAYQTGHFGSVLREDLNWTGFNEGKMNERCLCVSDHPIKIL